MIRRAVKFANKSDAVIVPTASITPTLRKWGVKKEITPVPTGVIEKDFEGANGKIVREKYGIKDDETVLLVVTRLTAEKNMEFLFRSVIETLKENKKIKFLIAADGYLRAELETLVTKSGVGNQVIFAGSVSNEEKKNFYAASDIFVFASKSETQGMVISEAMYMKLPIVAVAATGVESLVVNNGNGLLVKESIEEFSKAILKIIEKKELRKTFSDASFRIAKSQFTSSVTSKKMLELYERLLLNYSK
jgi:glycosyltransferase involved in cell wall biosynthesis